MQSTSIATENYLSSQEVACQGVLWEACLVEAYQEGAFPDPSLGVAFQEGACVLEEEEEEGGKKKETVWEDHELVV